MRRVMTLLATLSLLLLGLTACSDDPDEGTDSGSVNVTGEFGSEPTVELDDNFERIGLDTSVLSEGDGDTLAQGDSAFAQIMVVNAFDSDTSISSWETGGAELLELNESLPGLTEALVGQQVGSRVLIEARADKVFGEFGQPNLFIGPADSIVIVVDLVSRILDQVTSDPEEQEAGDPKVVLEGETPVSLDFSDTAEDAPTEPAVITLTEGDGPALTDDSVFVMRYLGQVWGGDEPFDQNYDRTLDAQPLTTYVPGFAELLPGVTVGSRVLLVLPPEQGYGEAGNEGAGIEGTDTIVFIIDVLGAYEPSELPAAEPEEDPDEDETAPDEDEATREAEGEEE